MQNKLPQIGSICLFDAPYGTDNILSTNELPKDGYTVRVEAHLHDEDFKGSVYEWLVIVSFKSLNTKGSYRIALVKPISLVETVREQEV